MVKDALYLLQQMQLEADYREADHEIDHSFDSTTADGIDLDETW